MSSGVVSKKLKFKGDKPKKKKRSHRETEGGDDLEALAAADPSGWVFPTNVMEITGPTFILLPTEPLTCLAWDSMREKVYAAPVDVPSAPEGANELSSSEIIGAVEPTDVNHVWVVSRLSGSDDVVSLRTPSGTFLTATPSGTLTATAPSRGPLEAFVPVLTLTESLFPIIALRTHSEKFVSVPPTTSAATSSSAARKTELRADADEAGVFEGMRVKCQREFVIKARLAAVEGTEGAAAKRRLLDRGPSLGSVEDELKRNREAQTWGGGKTVVSSLDRKELKKAARDGRIAEAMLDRRAAMKSDRYAK